MVLVGHSYGGIVITGVAEWVPDRIQRLVYLDASVPRDGKSNDTVIGPVMAAQLRASAVSEGEGWKVPPASYVIERLSGHPLREWVAARLKPHPLRPFAEPVAWARRKPRHCRERSSRQPSGTCIAGSSQELAKRVGTARRLAEATTRWSPNRKQ